MATLVHHWPIVLKSALLGSRTKRPCHAENAPGPPRRTPKETPGPIGVAPPSSLNAKLNPAPISFTGCPS
jgi:hypothetical protein